MTVKFGTADAETDPFQIDRVPKPFLWGYYDERGQLFFSRTEEFIDFIKRQKRKIYFHNGGKFDMHFLFEGLEPQERFMVINGRIAKMRIGDAELRDSWLLFPQPLSAYKKDEIDYSIFEDGERQKIDNARSIQSYLGGDCKYLYDILKVQFDTYGQKLTLASSAFDYWHKNFSPYKLKPKTNETFFLTFKPFYYGGRVECFQKGIINHDFKVHDINSAYPYAMLSDHPYGDEYSIHDCLPDDADIGRCFIKFSGRSTKGALPFRDDEKKLLFPRDNITRQFKVTGWEYKQAVECGGIEVDKLEAVYVFKNKINFKEYVEHFFEEKAKHKNGDAAKYLLAKLYMNALYGRFAMSPLEHKEYDLVEPCFIESYIKQGYEFEGEIGEWALMSVNKHVMEDGIYNVEPKFANVAVAASITGFVRAYLFKNILESDTPLYCDTDSIASVGFSGKIGVQLGEWECEGDFVRAAIAGKKLYSFERKLPKKGEKFKNSSKGVNLNEKEIFSVASGETVCYASIAPTFSINKAPTFLRRNVRMT